MEEGSGKKENSRDPLLQLSEALFKRYNYVLNIFLIFMGTLKLIS